MRHLREQQRAEPPQLRVAQLLELQGLLQGRSQSRFIHTFHTSQKSAFSELCPFMNVFAIRALLYTKVLYTKSMLLFALCGMRRHDRFTPQASHHTGEARRRRAVEVQEQRPGLQRRHGEAHRVQDLPPERVPEGGHAHRPRPRRQGQGLPLPQLPAEAGGRRARQQR